MSFRPVWVRQSEFISVQWKHDEIASAEMVENHYTYGYFCGPGGPGRMQLTFENRRTFVPRVPSERTADLF